MVEAALKKSIEKIEKEFMNCVRCGYCLQGCPTYDYYRMESATARGRLRITLSLFRDQLELNETVMKRIFQCFFCSHCEVVCPAGLNIVEALNAARIGIVASGKVTIPESLTTAIQNLKKTGNPYGKPLVERSKWIPPTVTIYPNSSTVYYPGCTAAYIEQPIAQASAEALQMAGIKFNVLGEKEYCCSGFALWSGYKDVYDDFIGKAAESFIKTGTQELIVSCAACYHVFNQHLRKEGLRVLHTSQVFAELLDQGKLKFPGRFEATVTYHDPCHLGRQENVYEEPRKVLENIPGLKFVEMGRNRRTAECCGGGAGVAGTAFPIPSLVIGEDRLKEAIDAGANVITSTCPFCYRILTLAAKRRRLPIKIYDLNQVINQAAKA
jgi:heterodisulfide reductase subunit D